MLAIAAVLTAVCAAAAFSSCGAPGIIGALGRPAPKAYGRELFYLDTHIEITAYADSGREGESALDAAEGVFRRVHEKMNRFGEGSDIYRINHARAGEGPVRIDEETFSLIKTAIGYCEQSGGAFDIGIGAVSDLWAFNPSSGAEGGASGVGAQPPDGVKKPPPPDTLAEAVAAGGYKKIVLNEADLTVYAPPGLSIDLGSIAKGYAAREAAEALKAAGVKNAVINAGGNVCAIGKKPGITINAKPAGAAKNADPAGPGGAASGRPDKDVSGGRPWRIGVRHPRPSRDSQLLAVVTVSDKAVVTSGDYERYFEYEGIRYHHILDPSTGMPARGIISVTVVADDSALADYLTTAVFVLGEREGLELAARYPGAEVLIMTSDMRAVCSPGFSGDITAG